MRWLRAIPEKSRVGRRLSLLHNRSAQTVVGTHVVHADRSLTRLVGLLGRRKLAAGEGLWIKPSSGVHTLGMRFTIDVVGLDHKLRVVQVVPRLRPWRLTLPRFAIKSVVELAAGEIAARSIRVGDQLEFESL